MVGILFEVASNRIQIDLFEEMLNGKIEKWPQNAKNGNSKWTLFDQS